MEDNSRERQRLKEVQRLTLIVLAVMTAVIIGYAVYGLVVKSINIKVFEIMLGCFVIVYPVLSDVVEPWRLGMLKDLTQERRTGYLKVILMDVIGSGALLYWIMGLDSEAGNSILIPFLIYFLTMQMKRKYRLEFEGKTEEGPEESSGESSEENSKGSLEDSLEESQEESAESGEQDEK